MNEISQKNAGLISQSGELKGNGGFIFFEGYWSFGFGVLALNPKENPSLQPFLPGET